MKTYPVYIVKFNGSSDCMGASYYAYAAKSPAMALKTAKKYAWGNGTADRGLGSCNIAIKHDTLRATKLGAVANLDLGNLHWQNRHYRKIE